MVDSSEGSIPGRGGSALVYVGQEGLSHNFILVAGASRDEQFDDVWRISVGLGPQGRTFTNTRLELGERDEFTARNGIAAVTKSPNQIVIFGGQDSQQEKMFNEMFTLDLNALTMKQHEYADGSIQPPPRNSHTLTKNGDKAYLFGGANQDGPLKDLYELDLASLTFKKIVLDESEMNMPMVEMHSAHILNGTHLLLIGGRKLEVGHQLADINFSDDMYTIELATGKVALFGRLPTALGSHVSAIVDDQFIVVYGGTNGLRFFDSLMRYNIEAKEWTLMTKQPEELVSSPFFNDGRIASCSDQFGNGFGLFFGGCSAERDCNDLMVVSFNHVREATNFSVINEIF